MEMFLGKSICDLQKFFRNMSSSYHQTWKIQYNSNIQFLLCSLISKIIANGQVYCNLCVSPKLQRIEQYLKQSRIHTWVCTGASIGLPLLAFGGSITRRGETFSPRISRTGRTIGGLGVSISLRRSGDLTSTLEPPSEFLPFPNLSSLRQSLITSALGLLL